MEQRKKETIFFIVIENSTLYKSNISKSVLGLQNRGCEPRRVSQVKTMSPVGCVLL